MTEPIEVEGQVIHRKPNAVEGDVEFVIILNYQYEKIKITTTKEEIKQNYIFPDENEPTECCDFTSCLLHYTHSQKYNELQSLEERQIINHNLKKINKIKKNKNFIVKQRYKYAKKSVTDLFSTLDLNFCELKQKYLFTALYDSDFVIFINNKNEKTKEKPFHPLCIAFINFKKEHDIQFLYISIFASDRKYGNCGGNLMNSIKYIAKLIKYSEIRLDSLNTINATQFYKNNNFIENENKKNHFVYQLKDDYATFKKLPPIKGEVSLIDQTECSNNKNGGKTKKKSRKSKKNKTRTI